MDVPLTTEELDLVLISLVAEERRSLDAYDGPGMQLRQGEEMPPADTPIGRIFRLGVLIHRLESEYVRRAVEKIG